VQSKPLATDPKLLALLEKAKSHVMTKAEKDAQRKSWVVGEFMLSHPEVTREYAEARCLNFSCGNGSVSINTYTGAVEFKDCDPDDAAKAFWKAVEHCFPFRDGR
jgi:hypothetical protein